MFLLLCRSILSLFQEQLRFWKMFCFYLHFKNYIFRNIWLQKQLIFLMILYAITHAITKEKRKKKEGLPSLVGAGEGEVDCAWAMGKIMVQTIAKTAKMPKEILETAIFFCFSLTLFFQFLVFFFDNVCNWSIKLRIFFVSPSMWMGRYGI